ncbi:MAG: hypothetical protein ACI4SM_02060 [Candidatus Gastranaerophilaceae bacterium]
MKIFENKKVDRKRTIKFFGLLLYSNEVSYEVRTQKFLCEALSAITIKNHSRNTKSKTVSLFTLPIFKNIYDESYHKKYILGILICKINLKKVLKKKFKQIFKSEYDHIYLLNCNSGEAFLFFSFVVENYLRKNGTKNPLFIVSQKYHVDIMNMFCPWYDKVHIKNFYYRSSFIAGNQFKIENKKFFKIFPFEYFKDVEDSIQKNNGDGSVHYFDKLLEYCNITKGELCNNKLQISQITEKYVLKKVRKETGIDSSNFVILVPEAASCEEIEPKFWTILCNKFSLQGYDVFMNIRDKDIEYKYCEYKTCDLSYTELTALAKHAKIIVSLRCGLTEVLMSTMTPLICINTAFKDREQFTKMPTDFVKSGYDISKLPCYNKDVHYDFNFNQNESLKLIDSIILIDKNIKRNGGRLETN